MSNADRLVHPDDGMVYACPDCDEAGDITIRHGDNTYAGDPDDDYACGRCGETFNEPTEREARTGGPGPKYADLSPEDLGLDTDA